MNKHFVPQSRNRRILYGLAALIIAFAGYAGMTMTPSSHATASIVGAHGPVAEVCPGTIYHC